MLGQALQIKLRFAKKFNEEQGVNGLHYADQQLVPTLPG